MLSRPNDAFKLHWFQPNYMLYRKSNACICEQQSILKNYFQSLKRKNKEQEKERLINCIQRTSELGFAHTDGSRSFSIGEVKTNKWHMMFKNIWIII